jgi:hypothetical protein
VNLAPRLAAIALAAISLAATRTASAQAGQLECGEDGPWRVALTSGLGVGTGAAAALTSAGIISAADDTRDYEFYVGALVGIGVTAGLTAVYAIYDGSTGCEMANTSSLGVVWSVPIVMFVLGAALPIAVWGASDEIGATPPPDDMMMDTARRGLSWGFRF